MTKDTVKIDVEFYDNEHRQLLTKSPNWVKILELTESGIEVPTSEFLTYFLYHRRAVNPQQYGSFDDLAKHTADALAMFRGVFVLTGDSIIVSPGVTRPENAQLEYFGEAVGLSVVNRIHELHQADWEKIETRGGGKDTKYFDYKNDKIASDGSRMVQIEAKGTFVEDTSEKGSSVYDHKGNIAAKKSKIEAREKEGVYPYPAHDRYGTIAAIDKGQHGIVRCWLMDPPGDGSDFDSKREQIMSRLRYALGWIAVLSPRSTLAIALQNRVRAIETVADISNLDNVPLSDGRGEPINPPLIGDGVAKGWFVGKSVVQGGGAGGFVTMIKRRERRDLVFLGLTGTLVETIVNQSFAQLSSFHQPPSSSRRHIFCRMTRKRFERYFSEDEALARFAEVRYQSNYVEFVVEDVVHVTPSGIAFSTIPIQDGH